MIRSIRTRGRVPHIRGTNTPAHAIKSAIGPVLNNSLISVSSPAENIRRITPISAIWTRKSVWATQPNIAERYFGIADITGAYVAGIVLCSLRDSGYIAQKMDTNSYMLFGPVFFASIGLKTNIDNLDGSILLFAAAFVAVGLIATDTYFAAAASSSGSPAYSTFSMIGVRIEDTIISKITAVK